MNNDIQVESLFTEPCPARLPRYCLARPGCEEGSMNNETARESLFNRCSRPISGNKKPRRLSPTGVYVELRGVEPLASRVRLLSLLISATRAVQRIFHKLALFRREVRFLSL